MSEVGGRSDEDAVPLGRAALVATASVTAFNASIYLMAVAVGVFGSMGWLPAGRTAEVKLGPVLVGSVIAALAGVGVYGLVRRHARRPYPTFLIIAAGVLAASMVVPFQMGWPLSQVLVLEVMHVVAAAGVIWAVSRQTMFLGHFGVALGAKRVAPRVSLGTLFLAAQLVDFLWPVLLLLGVERVNIVPGIMEANPLEFVEYPVTHSLLAAAGWSLLVGLIYYAVMRYRTGAWVVGVVVLSHWLLDLPMHGPDLPLWPGSDVRMGLGLWNSWPATLVVEFGILGLGLYLYLGWTRAMDRVGRWGLWGLVALLVAFYLLASFGPTPTAPDAIAWSALLMWGFVPLGYWVDRHRAAADPWVASAGPGV